MNCFFLAVRGNCDYLLLTVPCIWTVRQRGQLEAPLTAAWLLENTLFVFSRTMWTIAILRNPLPSFEGFCVVEIRIRRRLVPTTTVLFTAIFIPAPSRVRSPWVIPVPGHEAAAQVTS
jgi:hypothetical protein